MMSKRMRLTAILALVAAVVSLTAAGTGYAFHFPWDQGHDTCRPDAPTPPPDTCDKCNTNPSPYVAATGAYIVNRQDVFIPGRLPLEIIRTYHSRDLHNGMFGHGWMFNYGIRLIEATDGVDEVLIVRRPDGHRDRFRRGADGSYTNPVDVFDRLTRNGDGTWEMRDKEGTVFGFDAGGNLSSIVDHNGNQLSLTYDEVGALTAVTDADGRSLTFTKGANGKVASISDPAGRIVGYEYDADGNLIAVTDPRGAVTEYTYDAKGNLTGTIDAEGRFVASASYDGDGRLIGYMEEGETYTLTHVPAERRVLETDSRGNTRTIVYNENGNITSKSDGAGNVELVAYDADFNPSRYTDKNGNVTIYEYDGQANLVKKIDPLGNVTTYTHDVTHPQPVVQGRLVSFSYLRRVTKISESGRTTERSYDSRGNLTQEKVTAGSRVRTVSYSYDAKGQLLSIDGPRTDVNDVTTFTYDQYGNVATITDPLGRVTRSTYDIVGQLTRLESPNGVVTDFVYDAAGNEIVRDMNGERTLSTYDAVGLLESITFPNGLVTEYQHDAFGRLTETSDNDGTRLRFTLDARGNVLKREAFGPAGNLTETRSFEYDVLDRMIKEIGASGQTTLYEYDANGNRTKMTDPLGRVTLRTYDRLNRLASVTDPAGGRTQYAYDALGHLASVTDPLGNSTVYGVDGLGAEVSVDSPEAGLKRRTFDAADNVLTETDARGVTTRFEYNELNLLTRTVYADGTEETRAYAPGAEGEDVLTSLANPSGSVGWTYDADGRVTRQAQVVGGVTLALVNAYDAQGRLVQVTYPSGKVVELGYDQAGKLTSLEVDGQPLVSQVTYQPSGPVSGWTWGNGTSYRRSFDLDGNLIQFPLGPVAQSNTIDAANRITATSGGASRTYGYDGLDRLVSYGAPGTTQTYAYDANGNRLSFTENGQTTTYSYDGDSSRLLSRAGGATDTYTHDAAGNILSDGTRDFLYGARGRMEQVDAGSAPTTYLHNGLGQRVGKTAAGSSALAEIYVYDDQERLVGIYGGDGSPIAETVYLHDVPVGLLTGASTVHHVYTDQLSTPRVITDRQGTVVWRWDSDPFGVGAPDEDVDGDQTELVYNLRFPGQYFDAESGLHYNYFRDYDPTLGRYVQVDPLGLAGGLNVYLYANANPISFADPTGENPAAVARILKAIRDAWRALQAAIARCAKDPVCRCRAFYAAYKALCAIPCGGCNVPSVQCCAVTTAQASAAAGCVSLRSTYIAQKCDVHIPTTKDHPGALEQAQRALQNCTEKVGRVCKCIPQ